MKLTELSTALAVKLPPVPVKSGLTPVTMATSIAASTVIAVGTDLTGSVVRSLIITKIVSGVRSYQKFAITFTPPT